MKRETLNANVARVAAALVAAFCVLGLAAPHARAQGARASAQKKVAFYSCPMHPDVKSKTPGRCPKCKMDLRAAYADEGVAAEPSKKDEASERGGSSRMSIPDVALLDQDGREIHFYSDLVKGRVVAIQFIFTTCTTICPPLGARRSRRGAGRWSCTS